MCPQCWASEGVGTGSQGLGGGCPWALARLGLTSLVGGRGRTSVLMWVLAALSRTAQAASPGGQDAAWLGTPLGWALEDLSLFPGCWLRAPSAEEAGAQASPGRGVRRVVVLLGVVEPWPLRQWMRVPFTRNPPLGAWRKVGRLSSARLPQPGLSPWADVGSVRVSS